MLKTDCKFTFFCKIYDWKLLTIRSCLSPIVIARGAFNVSQNRFLFVYLFFLKIRCPWKLM